MSKRGKCRIGEGKDASKAQGQPMRDRRLSLEAPRAVGDDAEDINVGVGQLLCSTWAPTKPPEIGHPQHQKWAKFPRSIC
uniref:Uncharacterized protein n=1 Tax=Bosea sp. NBC_00436 TaxID=2969620 RepID=A0A9E7ZSG8_9HYPH